jgi:hypothetical protein
VKRNTGILLETVRFNKANLKAERYLSSLFTVLYVISGMRVFCCVLGPKKIAQGIGSEFKSHAKMNEKRSKKSVARTQMRIGMTT